MKTLITSIAITTALLTTSVQANETASAEIVAKALVHQQSAQVSHQVAAQVNQDIQYSLQTMRLPNVQSKELMLAKVDNKKDKTTRGE